MKTPVKATWTIVWAVMALSLVTAIGICAILAIIDNFGRDDE